jgi:hypothetical protein
MTGQDQKRSCFAMIPRIVLEARLTTYEMMIYLFIKDRAGEKGICTLSVDSLSKLAGMSDRKVQECLKSLSSVNPQIGVPLIAIEYRMGMSNAIRPVDVWALNEQKRKEGGDKTTPPAACTPPPTEREGEAHNPPRHVSLPPPLRSPKQEEKNTYVKETSKEKAPAQPADPLLPLSHKAKGERIAAEDIDAMAAYLDLIGKPIPEKVVARWLRLYGIKALTAAIQLLESQKAPIRNPGGWLTRALSENYIGRKANIARNRAFAVAFAKKYQLTQFKILKHYCVDLETGNDYQFDLPPETFERMLEQKYAYA